MVASADAPFLFFARARHRRPCTHADLSSRVENVKHENSTLRTENTVLKDYIDNLLAKVNDPGAGGAK